MGFLALIPLRVWLAIGLLVSFVLGVAWIDHRGYVRGKAEVRAEWDASRAADAVALNQANERNRKLEADHDAHIAAIGDHHAQEIADLEKRRARDAADARSGALRLRVPGACNSQSRAGEVQAAPQGSNGAQDGELRGEAAQDLTALAFDADRNTLQLTACQAVVTEYLHTQEKQ